MSFDDTLREYAAGAIAIERCQRLAVEIERTMPCEGLLFCPLQACVAMREALAEIAPPKKSNRIAPQISQSHATRHRGNYGAKHNGYKVATGASKSSLRHRDVGAFSAATIDDVDNWEVAHRAIINIVKQADGGHQSSRPAAGFLSLGAGCFRAGPRSSNY